MKPNTPAERLYNGIIKENPTFVLMLGMCPTLAITTSATNGIGMGLPEQHDDTSHSGAEER